MKGQIDVWPGVERAYARPGRAKIEGLEKQPLIRVVDEEKSEERRPEKKTEEKGRKEEKKEKKEPVIRIVE